MLTFKFNFNGKPCRTVYIEWDKITIGSGMPVDLIVDKKFWKNRGYLMLDPQNGGNNYIDVCEDASVDETEPVIEHCNITDIKFTYDQKFVEEWHPDYNCREIGQLNDIWCFLDNESENISHWSLSMFTQKLPRKLFLLCNWIYDNLVAGNTSEIDSELEQVGFTDLESFSLFLSEVYKDKLVELEIQISSVIMKAAIDNFKEKLKI